MAIFTNIAQYIPKQDVVYQSWWVSAPEQAELVDQLDGLSP